MMMVMRVLCEMRGERDKVVIRAFVEDYMYE